MHRFLVVHFAPMLRQDWEKVAAHVGAGLEVTFRRFTDKQERKRWLVIASVRLQQIPQSDELGCLIVPEDERTRCEAAAEHAINLVSVLESAGKTILSPRQCVALQPTSAPELQHLSASKGMRPTSKSEWAGASTIEWSDQIAAALADRMDGVALLSEAFSAGGETGTYRDLVRFLELAFARPFYDQKLANMLTKFLEPTRCGYDRAEVDDWIELRHPVTHADLKKTRRIAMTSDVRHTVLRMHQACLDVLFNKEKWRDPSAGRRAVWTPKAVSTSRTGDLKVKAGSTNVSLQFRIFDEFGIYPCDLGVGLDHAGTDLYAKFYRDPSKEPVGFQHTTEDATRFFTTVALE